MNAPVSASKKDVSLNHHIGVLGYDGSPSADFNPGSAYYDIGGADTYAKTNDAQLKMYQATRTAIADAEGKKRQRRERCRTTLRALRVLRG